jgi:hypothetical protein
MASLDITAADGALKTVYPSRRLKFIGYQGNPLLALLPKDENFGGDNKKMPIWYGGNQGASRQFSNAKNNKTPGLYKAFLLTRVRDYGLTDIDLETVQASANDEMAFLRLATAEIDNTVRTVGRNLAISLYRNKGGARGQVGSISSGVLTLLDPKDVTNFEVGMTVVNSTTDGTSGSQGSGSAVITAVDRRAGKLTASAWTNFSANDYLFRDGDFGLSISGLASWVPATTPSSGENFFGVDRSTDTRLYGQFLDGSALSIEEAIQDADTAVSIAGGQPSHLFMNPTDFNTLRKSLGSQVIFDKVRSPDMASVSFSTIKVMGANGEIQVVPDRNCPHNVAWLLDISTFEWGSLGAAPKILEGLGNKFIWNASADSIEIRTGYYGNLGCYAPGYNCQIKLA